jgi:7-cyano-7-deazaguanine synthase in queuosine biosynthesis
MELEVTDILGVDSLQQSCWALAQAYARKWPCANGRYTSIRLLQLAHYLEQDDSMNWSTWFNGVTKPVKFQRRHRIANMIGGGIDSFIAHFQAIEQYGLGEHVNVWVNYGQPYVNKEIDALQKVRKLVQAHSTHSFKFYELVIPTPYKIIEGFDYLFPCRNLLIASLGTVDALEIWISANKRDPNTTQGALDKTPYFFEEVSEIFSQYYDTTMLVRSPQIEYSKTEMIKWYLDHNYPVEWLFACSTCYHPTEQKCGVCYSCHKRRKAFKQLGIDEPGYPNKFEDNPNFEEFEAREQRKGRV